MNTQNIFTIQLEQEDTSEKPPPNEWEILRENTCSTISQLKKIKLSVYKEKLNLYSEKCKIKDDVILALQTCLETYKNTNENNNELISFLKTKLAERHSKMVALKKAHDSQNAGYESTICEKNEMINTQDGIIKVKEKQIEELTNKIKQQYELAIKSDELISSLRATIEDSEAKVKERDQKITQLETELATKAERIRTTQNLLKFDAALMLCKQNDRLVSGTIKELQEILSGENRSEIKVVSLPRIGPIKVAVENVATGPCWMIIQRRGYKMVDFNQGWFSFVEGFGNLDEDYWIGLDKIHAMTKSHMHELYIHLVFANNETRYAYYDNFAISGKSDDYKLRSLGNYVGNAGDGLRTHEHHIFRTIRYDTKTTVEYNRWWQHEYPNCNLNGTFSEKTEFGVWWCRCNGTYKFVESVQMLIRRKQV
ncbi:angiopoietin-related protein 7 isoform X2 [Drosophila navojoa]|uniref:angiopoietin-related protein 7 isoform X2 n=1 Tax=Drosophila navojoa TaxID=7232 RepID=UPI000847A052|nr:angiopoietin-related protein 7 isoform X2 [Drosophila navojoa]